MKKLYTKQVLLPLLAIVAFATVITSYYSFNHFRENESSEEEAEGIEKRRIIMEAFRQEFERTKDPALGVVPGYRLLQAQQYMKQRLANARAIQGINWVERGPTNVGGRTRALIYDLADNTYNTVFAGGVGGGLWKTTNIKAANTNWTKITDVLDNIAISTIAQHPTSHNILYFGTGEGWFNVDAIMGLGIWKSTDGGTTWNHLPATASFGNTQKIVVTSNGHIYAASSTKGITRSKDGGATWQTVVSGGAGADIELAANGDIYASVGIFAPGVLYKSPAGATVGNAGTWQDISPFSAANPDYQRLEIACAPSDANVVYVLAQDGPTYNCNAIFRTMDGGTTWIENNTTATPVVSDQVVLEPNFTRTQAWYDLICAVDPNNPLTIFIGGVDIHRSTTGGATWTLMTKWYDSPLSAWPLQAVVHADQHAIMFEPGSSSTGIFGNDGGVFLSTDLNNPALPSFTNENNNYNVTQFYAVAMHPEQEYFLCGAQDNGSQKFVGAGAVATSEASGGDGAFCHIDQLAPNTQFTSYVYSSYYRSTNGGSSFSNTINDVNHGQFINPTDYDNNSKVLYGDYTDVATRVGGSYSRWLTTGSTNTGVVVPDFGGASVSHVYVSPNVANRVYFGLANGRVVYVNSANTATTGSVSSSIIRTGVGTVSGIAIEPGNENHIIVTYSNYGVASVWETTNGGTNWTNIEGNLPDMPVRWVIFNPTNNDQALLATELGVWTTDNLDGTNTEWNPSNSGLANTRVDMLQFRTSDKMIAAATHGRGLFTAIIGGVNAPQLHYEKSNIVVEEQNPTVALACNRGYKDVTVKMFITDTPSAVTNVTIVPSAASTAVAGQDYEILGSNLSFSSSSSAPQSFTVRIYDDANLEPTEHIVLDYTLAGGSNAVKGTVFQRFEIEITDNEYAPFASYEQPLVTGPHTTNLGGSSPLQATQSDKKMQYLYRASELLANGITAGSYNKFSFYVGTKGSPAIPYMGFTIKIGQVGNTSSITSFQNDASFTTVYSAGPGGFIPAKGVNMINFTTPFVWDGSSNIVIQFCYDNAVAGAAGTDDILRGETMSYKCQVRQASANQPTDNGCAFTTHLNSYEFRPVLNFYKTIPETPVANVLNTSRQEYLGPYEEVYFYNTAGRVLAKVKNLTAHDYGCTQVILDRAGTGATQFQSTLPATFVTDKTFRVIPTNNNSNGQYEITLFYTAAEKAGWESATSRSWNNIQMIKVPSQISNVTPANPNPDGPNTAQYVTPIRGMIGTHYTLTYTFNSGFSGFAAGLSEAALPVTLLDFKGELRGNNAFLNWATTNEVNVKGYEVERSYDGVRFGKVGFVQASTSSANTKQYSFTDKDAAPEVSYYRIKMVDRNGQAKNSNVVMLKNRNAKQEIVVMNNPFNNYIDIRFGKMPQGKVNVKLVDLIGRIVAVASYSNLAQSYVRFNTNDKAVSQGIYLLTVEADNLRITQKVMKQ